MNLEKRVEQLEQQAGAGEEIMLIVVAFEHGRDEAGNVPPPREVIGYGPMGGAGPTWMREPGESVEECRGRVQREAKRLGSGVVAVCELYAEPAAA